MEILTLGDETAETSMHNVGALNMDADGNLWALFGEKYQSRRNAQDLSNGLGALLRIVPSREPGVVGYEAADGNPFADVPEASPDIFAYGLRSPWTGFRDSRGRFWIGDVGEDGWEEISVVTAPGQNFGRPIWEGPACRAEDCDPGDMVFPVRSWNHDRGHEFELDDPDVEPTVVRVAWVGMEYLDRGNDRYDGHFTSLVVYSDICLGWIRGIELGDDGSILRDGHIGHLPYSTA